MVVVLRRCVLGNDDDGRPGTLVKMLRNEAPRPTSVNTSAHTAHNDTCTSRGERTLSTEYA